MSTGSEIIGARPARSNRRLLIIGIVTLAVIVAIALDTKVVRIGSDLDLAEAGFSPEAFGARTFPTIQENVVSRAVDAVTLSEAIAADKAAAIEQYGVKAGIGAVMPVKFTGVAGEGKSGIYEVAVDGMPAETAIRVQTGPAINGTDLRDATGEFKFGDFTNQIEYQNAGAAINDAMKQAVLADMDTASLAGRTVSVVGVFTLINPKNWLVTPVEFTVQ